MLIIGLVFFKVLNLDNMLTACEIFFNKSILKITAMRKYANI